MCRQTSNTASNRLCLTFVAPVRKAVTWGRRLIRKGRPLSLGSKRITGEPAEAAGLSKSYTAPPDCRLTGTPVSPILRGVSGGRTLWDSPATRREWERIRRAENDISYLMTRFLAETAKGVWRYGVMIFGSMRGTGGVEVAFMALRQSWILHNLC